MAACKIGISGSYGGLNLGDEAILKSIVLQLRHTVDAEITVFSRDPKDTMACQNVDRAVAVRQLSRDEILPEIERLDLFILGGGGILFDEEVKIYLREVFLAEKRNIPVLVYAAGAGPLRDAGNQTLVRRALEKATVVTVREREAKKALEEAGLRREILITADPALLLEPEPVTSDALHWEGLDTDRRLIGFSVREPGPAAPDIDQQAYHTLLANAADYMVDRFDAEVVFVPMERKPDDFQHSHAVISQMLRPERAAVLKGGYTPGQLLELMGRFDFAVGMRLHFLMFAALREVPFVALPYSPKVFGFLDMLGIAAPPIQLVNAGRLAAHIDHSWDERRQLREKIRRILPDLQSKARETNQLVMRILRERCPGAIRSDA